MEDADNKDDLEDTARMLHEWEMRAAVHSGEYEFLKPQTVPLCAHHHRDVILLTLQKKEVHASTGPSPDSSITKELKISYQRMYDPQTTSLQDNAELAALHRGFNTLHTLLRNIENILYDKENEAPYFLFVYPWRWKEFRAIAATLQRVHILRAKIETAQKQAEVRFYAGLLKILPDYDPGREKAEIERLANDIVSLPCDF